MIRKLSTIVQIVSRLKFVIRCRLIFDFGYFENQKSLGIEVCQTMATNASGLLAVLAFYNVQPGPKPNKIADDEVNNKRLKEFRPPDIS